MDVIYQRRSIRKYTDEKVPREKLLELIKAGMNAPSAGNEQPWHFIVITDRSILLRIHEVHPYSLMLTEAAAGICVCGDPSLEKHKGYWVQDCAAATENILLEITAQGFGGVWLGVYPVEDRVAVFRNILGIPPGIIPFSLIAVGRPAEKKEPKNVFMNERIRYETWNGALYGG